MNQPVAEKIEEVKRSLNLTEIGVIVSLVSTLAMGVFTLGVLYAQVQKNSDDIADMKPKVEDVRLRVERIDANVAFLVERQRREGE